MNYMSIFKDDLINGEGVRVSLFVSGCSHGCKGCYSRHTWDYRSGNEYTTETEKTIIDELNKKYVNGLSLLGGDPLMPKNIDTTLDLSIKVKELYPNKNIWCWTGYTIDEIYKNHARTILDYIDVLIDGKYIESLKCSDLPFRGSSNQRLLKKGHDF